MSIDIKIALLKTFAFFIYSYILSEEQLVLEQLVFNSPILLLNLRYFKLYTVHIVKKKILQAPILSFPLFTICKANVIISITATYHIVLNN